MNDPAGSLACPICRTPVPVTADHRPPTFPFCSPRCRVRDLGAWSDGAYAIAGRDLAPTDDDTAPEGGYR
jgi:uncharacterized protein